MKKKKLNTRQLVGLIGLAALIAALVISVFLQNYSRPVENAEILFVGTHEDADCSIFLSDGHCVVIDAGEEQDASHIAQLLRDRGTETIDYLIVTHPDKDHIGGMEFLLEQFNINSLLTPYYGQFNAGYSELLKTAEERNVSHSNITDVQGFRCGDFDVTLYPPEESFYADDNEYSLVALVRHGDVTLLMTGDICRTRISEISGIDFGRVSLLKVPYHGRSSNPSADFIRRIAPEYAIVNAAAPESKIAKTLNKLSVVYYCTVGQDILFESDGDVLRYAGSEDI